MVQVHLTSVHHALTNYSNAVGANPKSINLHLLSGIVVSPTLGGFVLLASPELPSRHRRAFYQLTVI